MTADGPPPVTHHLRGDGWTATVTLTTVSGTVTSTIYEPLGDGDDAESEEPFRAACDAVEAVILGHAVAGINVSDPAYIAGIDAAVQAIVFHLG